MNRLKAFVAVILLSLMGSAALFFPLRAQDDYQKWQEQESRKFQNYQDEQDRNFSEFLNKEWIQLPAMSGTPLTSEPKPVAPIAAPEMPPRPTDSLIQQLPVVAPLQEFQPPIPPAPIPKEKQSMVPSRSGLSIAFYGEDLSLSCDPALNANLESPLSNRAISAYFNSLSRADWPSLIKQIQAERRRLSLNDWGYCLLLDAIARRLCPDSPSRASLLVWFLLLKSGFDARIGYAGETIFILLPFDHQIYETSYVTQGNRKYFAVSFAAKAPAMREVYTYDGSYPEADRVLKLTVNPPPAIGNETPEKIYRFNYNNREYRVSVRINSGLMDFYRYYPATDLEVYFDSQISPQAGYSLLSALRSVITGKSEVEAVDILLRFVQTAFPYRTDQDQFGREKYLFPDETLGYGASDCDDRAVLFAYLVWNLTGLEVVGLDWPGHVATGVRFSRDFPGEAVVYQGKQYLICDPTYVNARAGMCMPSVRDVAPKIIPVEIPNYAQVNFKPSLNK
jgi:hypothetical protein